MSILDQVKQVLSKKTQDNEGWIRQGKFTPGKNLSDVGKNIGNYFNAESNKGNNFWSSPLSRPLVSAQRDSLAVQNTPRVKLPKFQIKNPVGNFVANLPVNIAEGYANIPRNLLVSTTRAADLLGTNIGGAIGNQPVLTGKQMLDRTLSTLSPLGEAALDLYTPGAGKNIVNQLGKQAIKQAVKKGAISGSLMGGAGGALSELGLDRENVDYRKAAETGLVSALAGGVLGGAIGGGSAAIGQTVKKLAKEIRIQFPKLSPSQAEELAKKEIKIRINDPENSGRFKYLTPQEVNLVKKVERTQLIENQKGRLVEQPGGLLQDPNLKLVGGPKSVEFTRKNSLKKIPGVSSGTSYMEPITKEEWTKYNALIAKAREMRLKEQSGAIDFGADITLGNKGNTRAGNKNELTTQSSIPQSTKGVGGEGVKAEIKTLKQKLSSNYQKGNLVSSEQGIKKVWEERQALEARLNELEGQIKQADSIKMPSGLTAGEENAPALGFKLRKPNGEIVTPIKELGKDNAGVNQYLVINSKGGQEIAYGKNPRYAIDTNGSTPIRDMDQNDKTVKQVIESLSPSKGVGTKAPTNQALPQVEKPIKIKPVKPEAQVKEAILADEKIKASQEAQPKINVSGGPNGLKSPPSNDSISLSDEDLVKKMAQAIKEAKPLRGTQEQLYTQARSKQLARIMGVREKMAGEKGFFQELGALKGELPKVQYEAIRSQFTQGNVDRLFTMITTNKNLDEWEKINAQVGLSKILGEKGGGVPTKGELEKLYQVFGKDFTEALLSKRPFMEKLGDLGMQLYNLPRSFMAGVGDLSGTLMQNALFAYRHPILTGKNFVQELKFFASDKAFRMSQEEIASRPTYELMKKARLSLTETGPLVNQREEAFMSNLAEKIPGIGQVMKASGRAYTGFLNRMRADVFDQMVTSLKNMGGDVEDPKYLASLGEFINTATGRGSLGSLERVAPVIGQGFFSARKLVATIQTLNPMFYVRQHPQVRKEALYTMLSFLGGATAITQLSKLAGAEVGEDPTSTDFGKIKIGNTRFNMYGPYQQIAVLFARLWKGYATSSTTGKKMMLGDESNPYSPTRLDLLTRYFESKEHPTLSLIMSALRGTNSIGQPFNLPEETLNRFIPMVLSDGYDLYKEHGPKGLLGLIPSILGIPSQTYGSQVPYMTTTKAGNPSVKLKPVNGLAEEAVMRIKGEQPSNIPQDQWQGIIDAKNKETEKRNLKEELKSSGGSKLLDDTYVYINDKGEAKEIDLKRIKNIPPYPKLTGDANIDKEAISRYKTTLSGIVNDIYDLMEQGQITQEEASALMSQVKTNYNKTLKSKKPAKVSLKKSSNVKLSPLPQFKTPSFGKLGTTSYKVVSRPKIKLSTPKKIVVAPKTKTNNIKISRLPTMKVTKGGSLG